MPASFQNKCLPVTINIYEWSTQNILNLELASFQKCHVQLNSWACHSIRHKSLQLSSLFFSVYCGALLTALETSVLDASRILGSAASAWSWQAHWDLALKQLQFTPKWLLVRLGKLLVNRSSYWKCGAEHMGLHLGAGSGLKFGFSGDLRGIKSLI